MNTKLITHKQSLKYILIAFGLTVGLMFLQFTAAYYANSLALFADSSHLLIHNSSLLIALVSSFFSFKMAQKNSSEKAEIIDIVGGIINGCIFLSLAIVIFATGFERLENHHAGGVNVNPIIMAVSSFFAFCVHCLAAYVLSKGKKHSFNIHAIFLHTFFDCFSTLLTFCASIAILFTGIEHIDSIVSMVIAFFVTYSGTRLLRKCFKKVIYIRKSKLLVKNIDKALYESNCHIVDIHEQSINIDGKQKTYSAHIVLENICIKDKHCDNCLEEINKLLSEKFDINDTIIQLEYS